MNTAKQYGRWLFVISMFAWLVACGGQTQPQSPSAPPAPPAVPTLTGNKDVPIIGQGPVQATATPVAMRLLKVEPSNGAVGASFTINGDGFAPGKSVDFMWLTAEGSYTLVAGAENIEFHEKKFEDKRLSLGKATVDAQGKVSGVFKVPEDYGEVHDIFAVVDGIELGKGGYRIMRNVSINPTSGPIGTPITFKVTGLGWKAYESTLLIRYDNNPTGMVTAVTTKGSATFQVRAAGKRGKHVIDVNLGARAMAFLNNQQSGTAHIADARLEFTVTDDTVMPPYRLDWPDDSRLVMSGDAVPRTTTTSKTDPNVSMNFEPATGPILSRPMLRAKGLAANSEVEMFFISARGNRVNPSGWSLSETSLGKAKVGSDGTLATAVTIPDDLGGWHAVKLVGGGKVVAEAPFYVERSLVDVTPKRVKAGEIFTVHIKGVGWTELDNGTAITYDNTYIGFACGFNSNGDVTVNLTATGGPGIHLIDLYPMIYQGHGKPPWSYQTPFLTFAQDFPGLGLGYKLPTFRLAIEVIE
jgi:hypothetical protein